MRRAAIALSTTLALAAAGCGAVGGEAAAITTEDEVLDALLALEDGSTTRVTLDLVVDEDELRDALRDDPEARAVVEEALADAELDEDVDLAAEVAALQDTLARHAAVVRVADDHSVALALEHDDEVWLDLRGRAAPSTGEAALEGPAEVALQARFDADAAARALDSPELPDELDGLLAKVLPFLDAPEVAELAAVVTAFAAGELVGIGGALDPEGLLGELAPMAGDGGLAATGGAGAGLGAAGAGVLGLSTAEVDPRAFGAALLTLDGYRADGDATTMDVSLDLAAAAEVVAAATGEPLPDVEGLPDELTDVATLTIGDDGVVRGARVDLLSIASQLDAATPGEPDAERAEQAAAVARLAQQLETTGLFLDLAVTDVGALDTVLGDPTATITVDELVQQGFGLALLGGLGGAFGGAPPAG